MVVVIATLGAALAAGAVVIALRGDMPDRGWLALRNGLAVALPIAVGLYAWREATHARFGRLLVLGGFLWAVVALAASSEALPYSIGRDAGWLSEVAIVYLLLAFPSGRLPGRADRALVLYVGGRPDGTRIRGGGALAYDGARRERAHRWFRGLDQGQRTRA